MAKLSLPMTKLSFYDTVEKEANKKKIIEITNTYGTILGAVSTLCNVDKRILAAFIFLESAGKKDVVSSSGAVGLMQLKPSSAHDILVLEHVKGRFSEKEKAYISALIGKDDMDAIWKQKNLDPKLPSRISKADLLKPEVNIFCGAIYLGLLIDQHTKDGVVRLDEVVVRYNQGYFKKINTKSTAELLAQTTAIEAKSYITKLVGTNGVLTA